MDKGTKSKIENIALEQLKKYYEEYYYKNAATNPGQIKNIQYFLDWIKNDAKPSDIILTEVENYMRTCNMDVEIEYFWSFGGDSYSQYHYANGTLTGLFSSNKEFVNFFSDVFYSEHANSKIIPANLDEVAKELGRPELKKMDRTAIFSKARIKTYDITDPALDNYYRGIIYYPHPVADKEGNTTRTLFFIFWRGSIYFTNVNTSLPDDVSGKSRTGGCYVATAVYGSYDCPEVWTLRRYRDDTLASTWYGRAFIKLYYAISPTLVKWFGDKKWFKKMWKGKLDKMVNNLNEKGVENTPYKDKDWN